MKIIIISNIINHHTKSICDEFYSIYGEEFLFIATSFKTDKESLKGNNNLDFENLPYFFPAYKNNKNYNKAKKMCDCADIVIQQAAPDKFVRKRLRYNKLTFRVSERFIQGDWKDIFRYLKYFYRYYSVKNKELYFLGASAYACSDMRKSLSFKNKCYKWGYFPEVLSKKDGLLPTCDNRKLKFLWVGRFIDWKQPYLCIKVAEYLKELDEDFSITMVGSGPLFESIISTVNELNLNSYFIFKGFLSNSETQKVMQMSDVFLFTSNIKEGWGAVLNEAMANFCIPIASHEAGSVPFLIKHKKNGLIFENGNINSLLSNINFLVNNKDMFFQLKKNANYTVINEWGADKAVRNLLILIDSLLNKNKMTLNSGPASEAMPITPPEFIKSINK